MPLSPQEARTLLLEDQLHQAASTIEFLHGCLSDPVFEYAYLEMTQRQLSEIRQLVGQREGCSHGRHREDCQACQEHLRSWRLLREARQVLDSGENT